MDKRLRDFLGGLDARELKNKGDNYSYAEFYLMDRDNNILVGGLMDDYKMRVSLLDMKEKGELDRDDLTMKFCSFDEGVAWQDDRFVHIEESKNYAFPFSAKKDDDWDVSYNRFTGDRACSSTFIVNTVAFAIMDGKGKGSLDMESFFDNGDVSKILLTEKQDEQNMLLTPFERKALEFVDEWLKTEPVVEYKSDFSDNMTIPFGYYGERSETFDGLCDRLIGKKEDDIYKFITDNREGISKFLDGSDLATPNTEEYANTLWSDPRVFLSVMMAESVHSLTRTNSERVFTPYGQYPIDKDNAIFMKEFIQDIDTNLLRFRNYGRDADKGKQINDYNIETLAYYAEHVYKTKGRQATMEEVLSKKPFADLSPGEQSKKTMFRGFDRDDRDEFLFHRYGDAELMRKVMPKELFEIYRMYEHVPRPKAGLAKGKGLGDVLDNGLVVGK